MVLVDNNHALITNISKIIKNYQFRSNGVIDVLNKRKDKSPEKREILEQMINMIKQESSKKKLEDFRDELVTDPTKATDPDFLKKLKDFTESEQNN